ncbi:hypothetical protein LWI28_001163 [Acer negundo]|uniref:F-box domain-containing protein n=1 Tax=Acer negundo TaxID=4023 RepID=A0AAD5P0R8_ACENE|nr:hypothetical protein LWI28_001163 [Acer negundo]
MSGGSVQPFKNLPLPQEIVIDILSRLPVKSLCRFKCVSKSWLALTTDPLFVKLHLDRTKIHKIMLASRSLYSIDHETTPINEEVVSVQLDFPLKKNHTSDFVQIISSCNGLLCIMPEPEVFFVINPSTREYKRVQDFQNPTLSSLSDQSVYGFGYVQSIDDYKFVKYVCGSTVCVFSLKNNSWKFVEDSRYKCQLCVPGTPLNGAIHWVLKHQDGDCVIAAFDLVEERFKDLPLPDALTSFGVLSTGVLEGRLCVQHHQDMNVKQFWVMKEYGVKESWTRVLIQEGYRILKPLCLWKDCKILLAMDQKQLVLCNQRDGALKDFEVTGIPFHFDADVYVESLISPNCSKWN